MIQQEFVEELVKIVTTEQIKTDEPMSAHTTFRVGGAADILIQPRIPELKSVIELCRKYELPYTVIGNGSNLLVSDKGVRGAVIEFGKYASDIRIENNMLYAMAGAMLSKVAFLAAQAGLTGMEFASGIPGTVGGAVVMNAGAYGGEMSQIIKEVTVLTPEGETRVLSLEELKLGYRHSCIAECGYIVLSAAFLLKSGEKQKILDKMEELKQQRVTKQPLEYPSAGSTFKRPEGYFAGKLIMDAGLRGYTIGGAAVAEKHCGFVINKDDASAADIVKLMQHIQEEVRRQFGVALEPEVRKLGEFE